MAESIQCQNCGKPATVHLTQIVDNNIQKMDLCETCAKSEGVADSEAFSLSDLFENGAKTDAAGGSDAVCGSCGAPARYVREAGRLGCADCYMTFADLVHPMMKGLHRELRHKGKAPSTEARSRAASSLVLAELSENLKTAVADERFEDAARIRDEIAALREK